MSKNDQLLIGTLVTDPAHKALVKEYLDLAELEGPKWSALPLDLGDEVERFERLQIAAAYARCLGGRAELIERTQTVLMRSAVDALIIALDGIGERIQVHRGKGGLSPLMHHVVREFAAEVKETDWIFAASGSCRSAAFDLEDLIRSAAMQGEAGPRKVLEAHFKRATGVIERFDPKVIPGGMVGVALMWVTSLVGLGDLEDSNTTEHYVED